MNRSLILIFSIVFVFSTLSYSQWYNSSYSYRKEINLSYPLTINDIQVAINISYSANMSYNFSGLLFTYVNGTNEVEIPFWIEEKVNGSWAYIWVRLPQISTNEKIYVYYKNDSTLPEKSNGFLTFFLFDDFESPIFNTSIWAFSDPGFIPTILNGNLVSNQAVGTASQVGFDIASGYVSETRAKFNAFGSYYSGVFATPMSSSFTAPSNANADSTLLYMTTSGSSTSLYHWFGDGCASGYNVDSSGLPASLVLGRYYVFSTEVYTTGTTSTITLLLNRNALHSDTASFCKPLEFVRLGFFSNYVSGPNTEVYYDWVLVRKYYNMASLSYAIGPEESTSENVFVSILSPSDGSFIGSPFDVVINITSSNYTDVFLYVDGNLAYIWNNVANTTLTATLNLNVGNHSILVNSSLGSFISSDSIGVVVLSQQQDIIVSEGDSQTSIQYNITNIQNETYVFVNQEIIEDNKSLKTFKEEPNETGKVREIIFLQTPIITYQEDYTYLLLSIIALLIIIILLLLLILVFRRRKEK